MKPEPDDYVRAAKLSGALERELRRMNRWSKPLSADAFENMGAFGQNTMAFEQWIQFVLLDRLRTIIDEQGDFPDGSMISAYANRVFNGDPEAGQLLDLLYQLDQLVNSAHPTHAVEKVEQVQNPQSKTITTKSNTLPDVVYTLIETLPQFEGEDLESQLQTYDIFLNICSPSVRPELRLLLLKASHLAKNDMTKKRIEEAAKSVAEGKRAAEPYDHSLAIKKYQAEHRRNFPD